MTGRVYSMPEEKPKPVHAIRLKDPILEELKLPPASVTPLGLGDAPPASRSGRYLVKLGAEPFSAAVGARLREAFAGPAGATGMLLAESDRPFDAASLAAARNALWPAFHVTRAYRVRNQQYVEKLTPEGWETLREHFVATWSGSAIAAIPRAAAFAPEAVARKFDKNAAGWSGDPKSPLYAHHRWMRRIVAELGEPRPGERALDAGCGAGWVGIEAAKRGAKVSAFDPSAEMVKIALENAAAEGVALEAQQGFVEKAPWSEPFSLVLNSGVVSFAEDAARYFAALEALVARGGRLVIGDLNPRSRGMERRRREEPVLPIRELNALPRAEAIRALEEKGLRVTARRYYQRTSPFPEIMHFLARRLGGLGCGFLLARNASAASRDSDDEAGFDSWLLRADKP